jgi:hypothetical protein
MSAQPAKTDFYRILVAIETDATRYYGPKASRPALLAPSEAEQLLAHVAADLKNLLPDISACSLITVGALFDQTQVLRPGYPVFSALEASATRRGADAFKAGLVSIGAKEGKMPLEALQPLDNIPLGLLQLLPVVVHGPAGLVAELGQAMEYRFIEEGQVSAHSAAWLETAFGIRINHGRLMTLTDLNAMLRLQLEHFGFLPLWELLDAAMIGREEPLEVRTESGRRFEWKDGRVHATFETFDYWASAGAGAKVSAARQALAEAYGAWTRETRQYLTTLKAHGLEVCFHRPGEEQGLGGSFFSEPSEGRSADGDSAITEHSYAELGTIAITVSEDGQLENFYPLTPQGLNDVHAHLRERLAGGHTVAFPGSILYDEKSRRLIADSSKQP